jgi:succinate dehydrogenase / fumarate reductase cytochrome b subunit
MAITGLIGIGFLLAHMAGNLKLYAGEAQMNGYADWLRELLYPGLPHSGALWILRSILIVCVALHVHAAVALTIANRRARPIGYRGGRNYLAADYAARTMRWSGIIVLAFIVFHLADLTWGVEAANPDYVHGQPYQNTVESFSRWPVASFYIVANVLLGIHIYHGAWSLFQSLGWNNLRFNAWRRYFAAGLASVIVAGNVSFPIAVLTGVIE